MPEQRLVAGGLMLALSLALTGCNSASDDPVTGGGGQAEPLLEPGENEALLYYKRTDENYSGWGLHLWNTPADGCDGLAEGVATEWSTPRLPDGINDTYGA